MSGESTLWHYTDVHGFYGIISSNALRLGNALFLNDSTERTFGRERITELLKFESDNSPSPLMARLNEYWNSKTAGAAEYYILSLSESADTISQWQRYGADGRGYCLGVEWRAIKQPRLPIHLRRMLYSYESQQERFRAFMKDSTPRAEAQYPQSSEYTNDQTLQLQAAYLSGVLDEVALEFKNPRFEDEREWRLVRQVPDISSVADPEVKFAPRGEVVKPFIEVALGELCASESVGAVIDQLICGPKADPDLVIETARRLLRACGHDGVNIQHSALHKIWR